ncbi:OB-fold-containig protein [Crassaminicella thermophila]|nr:OB-fold-containig protein [Crassaminicella thermophila]
MIYKITFITGILYAVTSLVLGHLFDAVDMDFDGDMHIHFFTILPIKPITIIAFITVFGGVGIMCSNKGVRPIFTFLIAIFLAYAIALLVYRFIMIPLYKVQNTSAASQKELIGLDAVVKSSIMERGFGQIAYVKNGNTYYSPAKHVKGEYIEAGTKVFIVDIKDNIYYVEKKNFYYEIEVNI